MPMTVEQIEKEPLALPSLVRARLADRLVEGLADPDLTRVDRLWAADAKRRRDEVLGGQVQPISGSEALARQRPQTLNRSSTLISANSTKTGCGPFPD